MSRGTITEEIIEKYHMTTKEFRLIPYVQYLLVNQMPIDPQKIDEEERKILQNWRDKGYLTFSMREPLTVSREFWDIMNNYLWDSYVLQKKADDKIYDTGFLLTQNAPSGDLIVKNCFLITENATIGVVIKGLFPNADYESGKQFMHITNINSIGELSIPLDVWNAPYKTESEEI